MTGKRACLVVAAVMGIAAASLPSAAAADTFTVTSKDGSGAGSLRKAVADANANAGHDEITFADSLGPNILAGSHDLGPIEITSNLDIKGPGRKAPPGHQRPKPELRRADLQRDRRRTPRSRTCFRFK